MDTFRFPAVGYVTSPGIDTLRFPVIGYVAPPGMDTLRFLAVLGVYYFAGDNDDLEFYW